ncbi:MAG TPA: glycosyl hydrolase [Thermoanaerobaculia bacterium]|nr:glycosyl hydrolase [Thermoanaerobaculia bacterium]
MWNLQRMLRCLAGTAAGLALVACPVLAQEAQPAAPVELDSNSFGGLTARALGPAVMSGRIAAIAGVAGDPNAPTTVYVGAAGGGVWRSRDAGVTFQPVFDEHSQSIGAIAVDPREPQTVWVGTGETWVRNSVSVGDGVYKSTDGGDSWQRMGLENSERIARIRVSPKDGNVVWVCATGHLWDSHDERGVYKTADGGKTWKRVLSVDAETGCSDLDVDPQDPRIVYAGLWQFRRTGWSFHSGGKGSGVYKSTDGGETWKPLTEGLPKGEKGRIAIAVAPSRPAVVYALVEAAKTALYRSDDTGATWTEVNASSNVQVRPFYFAHIVVDPTDFDRIYKPGLVLTASSDGGKSFGSLLSQGGFGGGIHSDHHALWINPKNPYEMFLGTDGGVYHSQDRARKWRLIKSLPVSQFYRVSYDMARPYNVYGGLQDNGSWMGPSRGMFGSVQNKDWRNIGMGDGFYAFSDPTDPDNVYVEYQGGMISRLRLSTGEAKEIKPFPGDRDPEYRFNWNTPVHVGRHEPGTLYFGSQFLFRSRDKGESWEKISPDLTTNDRAKQGQEESGGLTVDNSSAENHTTVYSISESPRATGVIWVGTDDGNVQVTRDNGATWTNVVGNVPGLPRNTWVSSVEASHYDDATAYATFDGHTTGDMKAYVYRTADFGKTWQPLATPAIEGYAHIVREDLVNPDLLFLGTEHGLWISLDRGARWTRFTGNFPNVAVRDLAIHPRESDLIIATHGRGIYILDDLTPLRNLTAQVLDSEVALLPSRPSSLVIPVPSQDFPGDDEFAGRNPEEAAAITYYLKKRHVLGDLKVEVYDPQGNLVSTLPAGKRRGVNRVDWPMRLPAPKVPAASSLVMSQYAMVGPRVPAGTYTVKLIKGDQTLNGEVRLVPDPRSTHTDEDRAQQYQAAMDLYRMMERLTWLAESAAEVRDAANQRAEALPKGDRLRPQLARLAADVERYRGTLVATSEAGWMSGEEKLREKMGMLYGAVNGYEGRPTRSQLEYSKVLGGRLDQAASQFEAFKKDDLAAANRALEGKKLEPIKVSTLEEWREKQKK